MAEAAQAPLAPQSGSAARVLAPGVQASRLCVRDLHGEVLVGPVSFTLAPGSLNILTGATPAGRYALVAALTGRLPLTRVRQHGAMVVFGHSAPTGIRALTTLVLPWQSPGTSTGERRHQALAWADSQHTALAGMCPGLEGLSGADQESLLRVGHRLRDHGVIVVLSANNRDLTAATLQQADATIDLDEPRW
mgnify:CR=1 FL=1